MEKVITATGKRFDCDYFNPFPPAAQVNIRVLGVSLVEVASVFGNPAETVQMWWDQQYIASHTKLIAIVPEGDAVRVVLGKE